MRTVPKVSVIIPVYNVAPYLRQCLGSVVNQTMRDIEAVCVDDGSTDGSAAILQEYAANDTRIKVISIPNSGTVVARQEAVAAATGEWCLFLDPDDWLEADACEKFVAFAYVENADIVQCGFFLHETAPRPMAQKNASEAYFNCQPVRVEGVRLLEEIYQERTLPWNLIGRMIRASVCKVAFAEQIKAYSINETDVYAVFHIIAHANALAVMPHRLYNYRYGVGVSTKREMGLAEFSRLLGKFDTFDELMRYTAHAAPDSPQRRAVAAIGEQMFRSTFLTAASGRIARPEDRKKAFALLCKKLSYSRVADFLVRFYRDSPVNLADHLDSLGAIEPIDPPKTIRKVGIFYFHLAMGGVMRVIEAEVEGLRKAGVDVVLFADDDGAPVELRVPDGVEIVRLPPLMGQARASAEERFAGLVAALKDHPVDVFHSHQGLEPRTVFDLVACRMVCRIPFWLHYHSVSTATLWTAPSLASYLNEPARLRLCDGVFVLNGMDAMVLAALGANAVDVGNPLTKCAAGGLCAAPGAKDNDLVLWMGRLSGEKHPGEAVRVFARARQNHPGLRLAMVCAGTPNALKGLEEIVEREGVGDAVEIHGVTDDPSACLAKASVMLVTSDFEGYGLAVQEALAHGVPVVSYAQEALTLYRGNRAVVQVPPRDIMAAAAALCDVLASSDMPELRKLARSSVPQVTPEEFARRLTDAFSGTCPRSGASAPDSGFAVYLGMQRRALADLHKRRSAQMDKLGAERDDWRGKAQDNAAKISETEVRLGGELAREREMRMNAESAYKSALDGKNAISARFEEVSRKLSQEKAALSRLTLENEAIKGSVSFKVGRFLTCPARAVRQLVRRICGKSGAAKTAGGLAHS